MNPHQCHFIILNFQMKSREKQNKRIEGAGSCIIIHTRLLHQYKMLLDLSDAGCSLNFVRFLTRRQEGAHQSSSLKETDKRNQSLSAMQQNITWVVSRTLSLSLHTKRAETCDSRTLDAFKSPAGSFWVPFFRNWIALSAFRSLTLLHILYVFISV